MAVFIVFFLIKNKWIATYIVWAILCTLMKYTPLAYVTMHTIFIGVVFYQVFANCLDKERVKLALNAICIIAFIQVGIMVLQYFGAWLIIFPKVVGASTNAEFIETSTYVGKFLIINRGDYPIFGFMSNTNMASSLLAVCLPAFFRKKWKLFIPIVLLGLALSRGFGGIIPAGLVLSWYIWYGAGRYRWPIIASIMGIIIFYFLEKKPFKVGYTSSLWLRYMVWKQIILEVIPVHWIKGWGTGHFATVYETTMARRDIIAHNEYLQVWVEHGTIGFAIVLGYVVSTLKRIFKRHTETSRAIMAGLVVCFLNSGVNFLAHTTVMVVMLVYMALYEKECQS